MAALIPMLPIDFQEFMIMPKGAPTFSEALRYGTEVFHALKSVLKSRGLSTAVGDEGGFAPNLKGVEDTLDTISQAIEKAGYKLGEDIFLALDAASSEFFDASTGTYVFKKSDGSRKSADELVAFYQEICSKYPIVSIEDGCSENDWVGWKKLTDVLGAKVQLVGDDLFVTNVEFLRKGIEQGVGNSILVKVNQIGSSNRNSGRNRASQRERLHRRDQPSIRRDRRHHHCRYCRGYQCRTDQNRITFTNRSYRQVQSTAANRRRTW